MRLLDRQTATRASNGRFAEAGRNIPGSPNPALPAGPEQHFHVK